MPLSAHAIAAAFRQRQPGMGVKKLHKLLYYAQGHHLAAFGQPLFRESISAWDMGPVVGQVWGDEKYGALIEEPPELTEAELNTIGYVLSRYGGLTATDLENLTHSEAPWQRADRGRPPGGKARIELEWLQEFFANQVDDDEDEPQPDHAEFARMLDGIEQRRAEPAAPDSPEDIRAWLAARA
ncbi:Panacea domain-containing protein [Streptosporangium sp. NPDC006930]|uniref:Panacea domain-containing protein n=1 Tax=unclassified Streptosporangium TaxID=2632669 RepID=UPI00342DB664